MPATLFEVILIEIQEEIHHFAGWEGGGLRGTKIVNKHFVNEWAFPIFVLFGSFPIFAGFSRFVQELSGDFPDLSFSSFLAY